MDAKIRKVDKEEVWEIRHKVMWPDKELDYIKLEDDDVGIHFGFFKEDRLISAISLFIDEGEAQFRKFATIQQEQGKGYGSALLNAVLKEAESHGVDKIWCNARKEKSNFYKKFGLVETNTCFIKEGKSYIIMERFL
jgi:GNAT superfamily N-acetyltransferase